MAFVGPRQADRAHGVARDRQDDHRRPRGGLRVCSAFHFEKARAEVLRHRGLSFPSTQEQTNNKRLVMTHRPLGVVAAITPYNFPTDISSITIDPHHRGRQYGDLEAVRVLSDRCAMVAKLFEEAGLPPGVVNLLQGFGDVGAALVNHEGVDGVFFTGSTTGGEDHYGRALKPQLLELGGDGPFLILDELTWTLRWKER